MTSDTFASNSYKAIQTERQLLNIHDYDTLPTMHSLFQIFFNYLIIDKALLEEINPLQKLLNCIIIFRKNSYKIILNNKFFTFLKVVIYIF